MTVFPALLALWHEQVTTSASAFTACFNGFYNDSAPGDCITGPPPTNMSSVSVHSPSSAAQSAVRQELPSIVSNLSCYVQLDTPYSGGLNVSLPPPTARTSRSFHSKI